MLTMMKVLLIPLCAAALAQGVSAVTVSNREITPNAGNGNNATVEFEFNNPLHSSVAGKIFDVRGAHVADMTADCPDVPSFECLRWDARSNGHIVPGGVYIYALSAQGWSYSGTVVVVK